MIYHFDILASTNDEAAKPTYGEGDIIWADQQSAGRGQRGHKWESRRGENITFSAIFEPRFVPILRQFLLSQAVALGVVDALRYYGIVAKIKWTNDIYVGDRKLAGILIEHKLQGSEIGRTIAGIGLNVNQMQTILYNAFDRVKEATGQDPLEVFTKALENIMPVLEVRSRRIGGQNYQVPVEVRPERKQTLGLRWLVKYARLRNDKTMEEKLAKEIMDAANGVGAACKKREDTHKMAEANRAFAHYRW